MENPIKTPTQNRIFPKFTLATKIVGFFAASIIMTGFLQAFGVIDLHGMLLSQSDKYSIADSKTLTTKNPTNGSGVISTKGLTDVWSGTYSYTYNLTSQGKVPFTGKFSLSFSRDGDSIKGSYTQYSGEEVTTENIIGTIIGTQIKFNDDWCPATDVYSSGCFRFVGTISGNSLNLIAERCLFNTFCTSRYSASSQNPAIKGTVTLTR